MVVRYEVPTEFPPGKDCPLCRGGINEWGHTPTCHAVQRELADLRGRVDPRVAEVVSAAIALRDGLQGRMRPAPGTQDRLWNALDALPALWATPHEANNEVKTYDLADARTWLNEIIGYEGIGEHMTKKEKEAAMIVLAILDDTVSPSGEGG